MQTAKADNGDGGIGHVISALVACDGSAGHPHVNALLERGRASNSYPLYDLADMVYYLCQLHGRFPGVIDHAANRIVENEAREWVLQAADAFAVERAFLTQLSVALGPAPSTSGQNQADGVILQQRHALDMLAQSDRRGCAMGAALTLCLDWHGVRSVMDMAALRAGIEPPRTTLPSMAQTLRVADALTVDSAMSRAVEFGARQLLSQHRGLWDLLQARTQVRASHY